MRSVFDSSGGTLWLAPALGGVMLIVAGVLVIAFPILINCAVSSLLIFVGMLLIALAWQKRGRVTITRIDESYRSVDSDQD